MTIVYHLDMERTIGAAAFKEKCLSLLDEVERDGIVITKHGKPVARLVPILEESRNLIGALEGELEILGDVLTTDSSWNAQS